MVGVSVKELSNLSEGEQELMLKAPLLVCILIAGADGTIDRKEIREAINVAHAQKKGDSALGAYFKEVSQDFEDKLKILIQSYPYESTQRAPLVVEELSQINKLWKKVDKVFSVQLYRMLRDLANRIATSSGGLFGMKTVAAEEAKYVGLSMLADPATI